MYRDGSSKVVYQVKCKGFFDFKGIAKTTNNELQDIINSTKTKNLILTVKKSAKEVEYIVPMTYESIVNEDVVLSKQLDRRLVIDVLEVEITTENMEKIQK